jgi:GDP-mannose 6-dehydrogenase
MTSILVFGLGYVGSVAAACMARDGHTVVGVDVAEHKVALINQGKAPIVEKGLDDLIAKTVQSKKLVATTDATPYFKEHIFCLCGDTLSKKWQFGYTLFNRHMCANW